MPASPRRLVCLLGAALALLLLSGAEDAGAHLSAIDIGTGRQAAAATAPVAPRRAAGAGSRAAGRPHETATGAFDRVEPNEETKRFIADPLWVGASIIVSDYGLSDEAGKYTDFIVQPR